MKVGKVLKLPIKKNNKIIKVWTLRNLFADPTRLYLERSNLPCGQNPGADPQGYQRSALEPEQKMRETHLQICLRAVGSGRQGPGSVPEDHRRPEVLPEVEDGSSRLLLPGATQLHRAQRYIKALDESFLTESEEDRSLRRRGETGGDEPCFNLVLDFVLNLRKVKMNKM